MKLNRMTWGLILTMACGVATSAGAQGKKKADTPPDPKQIQKLFEEFAKTGKEHALFKQFVGRWDCAVLTFYPNPAKPTKSKGSSRIRLVMGGRFMQQYFRGVMDGKPFQGCVLWSLRRAARSRPSPVD